MDETKRTGDDDAGKLDPITPMATADSYDIGSIEKFEDDARNRDFYGGSVTDAYRIKSEIVNKCMEDIGMGRYQWELFVVTGCS